MSTAAATSSSGDRGPADGETARGRDGEGGGPAGIRVSACPAGSPPSSRVGSVVAARTRSISPTTGSLSQVALVAPGRSDGNGPDDESRVEQVLHAVPVAPLAQEGSASASFAGAAGKGHGRSTRLERRRRAGSSRKRRRSYLSAVRLWC